MAGLRMEGTITIRLRIHDLPPTALTDLAFDADWLRKKLPTLPYTDKTGRKSEPISDKGYTVIECAASVRPEVGAPSCDPPQVLL